MKQSTYLRKVINALKNAGWILVSVDDGDGPQKVSGTAAAMEAVSAVEDAVLEFEKRTTGTAVESSFIRVVWQGPDESYEEGEEIVSDYGMKLDSVISSVSENRNPPRKTTRKKAARKSARQAVQKCMWFRDCKNAATGTTKHPILGDVPTCERCNKFATNPKAKKNPRGLMWASPSRKSQFDGATVIGVEVYEIKYRHGTDGQDYVHAFETPAIMLGLPDGRIVIESSKGLKLWEVRNV